MTENFKTFHTVILLIFFIGPESAKLLRHPKEMADASDSTKTDQQFNENEFDNEILLEEEFFTLGSELSPFVPTSPSELFLAFVLCFPSLLFILYLVVVLYR